MGTRGWRRTAAARFGSAQLARRPNQNTIRTLIRTIRTTEALTTFFFFFCFFAFVFLQVLARVHIKFHSRGLALPWQFGSSVCLFCRDVPAITTIGLYTPPTVMCRSNPFLPFVIHLAAAMKIACFTGLPIA
jgi:hypothetical protein